VQWGDYGLVWAGTGLELAVHHRDAGARMAAPCAPSLGLLIAWLLARTDFRGKAQLRVRRRC